MAPKASVDKSTSIRAASKNKQRSQPSNRPAASPFGSSAGGSLAGSLSSLFSPQPHGKDAALASLLASTSKPAPSIGAKSGLSAFGSFSAAQPPAASNSSTAQPLQLLDQKQKSKQAEPKVDPKDAAPNKPQSASSKDAQPRSNPDQSSERPNPSGQATSSKSSTPASVSSIPKAAPQVPAGRRPVFRPVLASSTAVSWPEMPVAGSKTVLHTLLEMLASPDVKDAVLKDLGRRSRHSASKHKLETAASAGPQVLAGINSITRALEAEIQDDLQRLQTSAAEDAKQKEKSSALPPRIEIIFVCRQDVASPTLIAHLPMLVTARNAASSACGEGHGVLLFALPSGSEALIAKALGLRRASAVAFTSAFPSTHLRRLLDAVERETGSVCRLHADWLETALRTAKQSGKRARSLQQIPPTVKLLRTTQPLDLNASKAVKKSRRKERSARWKKRKMQLQQSIRSLRAELKHANKKQRQAKIKASSEAPMLIDA